MITDAVRERFLRDPVQTRLGGLAADLARIASFGENPTNHQAIASLLEESKYFAEWIAPEAPLETQAVLAELQVMLALWERRWLNGVEIPSMQVQAEQQSAVLLTLAGFV